MRHGCREGKGRIKGNTLICDECPLCVRHLASPPISIEGRGALDMPDK